MEVTHIDGRPVGEVLEHDLYPYLFASTPQARDFWAYPVLLNRPLGTRVSLGVRDLDGTARAVMLTRVRLDPGTFSAAEGFLIPLHYNRRATLVAQPVSGSTSQPLSISLTGGCPAFICTRWDTYPDGREFGRCRGDAGCGGIPDPGGDSRGLVVGRQGPDSG